MATEPSSNITCSNFSIFLFAYILKVLSSESGIFIPSIFISGLDIVVVSKVVVSVVVSCTIFSLTFIILSLLFHITSSPIASLTKRTGIIVFPFISLGGISILNKFPFTVAFTSFIFIRTTISLYTICTCSVAFIQVTSAPIFSNASLAGTSV